MQDKLELQGIREDWLGPWVTLDEVGGNLDAVQPRSAGPGVVRRSPSQSQAAVPAALFFGSASLEPTSRSALPLLSRVAAGSEDPAAGLGERSGTLLKAAADDAEGFSSLTCPPVQLPSRVDTEDAAPLGSLLFERRGRNPRARSSLLLGTSPGSRQQDPKAGKERKSEGAGALQTPASS